ncbi:MAG: hypothetical protein IJV80_00875, partial [Clostridia bacterium]|nr:hypothetical protein [Clostridia bacterium]
GEGSLLYDNKNQPITYVAELDSELVSVYLNGDVFLTFTFDELNDNLIVEFNLQDNLRDDTVLRMFRYDEYFGEWISNNPIFEIVSFNGFGAYNTIYTAEQNSVALSGELTLFIDNEEVKVPYALEDPTSLAASFTYEGIEYTLTFDLSTGKATVSGGVSDVVLERKDDFAEIELISQNGAIYSFDGRGNLASKGTMTVRNGKTVQTFLYAINGENVDVSLPSTPNTVAYSIVKDGSVYRFSTDNTVELKIYTAFTGTWAMSESFETFTVSGRDLNGTITGVYKNTNVVFEQIDEYTLKFKHNNSDLYLLALEYEGLAVSLYPAIYAGSFTICARVDDLFGDWKKISGPFELTLSFDGMSNSNYQPGCAVIKHRDTAVYYNYLITPDNDIILYAMQALNNKYYNYVVQWVDSSDPLAYTNGEQYFRLIEIDALFKTTLTYNDVDYTFDGQGTATDEHGNTYTYEIKNFTMDEKNKTYVSVTVELEKDGVKQTITFEL